MKTTLLLILITICKTAFTQTAETNLKIDIVFSYNCKFETIQDSSFMLFYSKGQFFRQKIINGSFFLPEINLSIVDSVIAEINGKKMKLDGMENDDFGIIFKPILPIFKLNISYTDQLDCLAEISATFIFDKLDKVKYVYSWHYEGYCCEITIVKEDE